ncbi:MAG: PKD domain-containing protein [Bacteroidota bacterium]
MKSRILFYIAIIGISIATVASAHCAPFSAVTSVDWVTITPAIAPCAGEESEFRGATDLAGAIRWNWDFGDGSTEVESPAGGVSAEGKDTTKIKHRFLKGGQYSVRLRVLYKWSSGLEDTVVQNVIIPDLPRPVIDERNIIICPGNSARLHVNSGFKSYKWTHNGTPVAHHPEAPTELIVSKAGFYTVTVQNEDGCSGTDSVEIVVLRDLTAGITGTDETCLEAVDIYKAEGLLELNDTNITYGWGTEGGEIVSGQGTPVVRIKWKREGIQQLHFQAIDPATTCSKDTIFTVEVGTALTVAITGNVVMCEGVTTELQAKSAAGNNAFYQWVYNGLTLSGETKPTLIAGKTGTYSVQVISETGCRGEASIDVTVSPLPEKPQISGATVLCGDAANTTLTLLTPEKYSRYEWSFDDTPIAGEPGSSIVTTKPGKYGITVYNIAGCTNTTTTDIVQFVAMRVGNDTAICRGQGVALNSLASGQDNLQYRWVPSSGLSDPNIANPVASPNSSTLYRVTISTPDGSCSKEDSVNVTIADFPETSVRDVELCEGETVELFLDVANEPAGKPFTYTWVPSIGLSDPNIARPIVTATTTQSYTITVENETGCSTTKTLTVNVREIEKVKAELITQKKAVIPDQSTSVTVQIGAQGKALTSFKAKVKYDRAVFRYIQKSIAFLLGTINTWEIHAEEVTPGELLIEAEGATPIQNMIIGFDFITYLDKQTDENVLLEITEVNGESTQIENRCRTITTKSAVLKVQDICGGELRLVNISLDSTYLLAISPNPATENAVRIDYSIGIEGDAAMEIYNQQGILVATLLKGRQAQGIQTATLNTRELSAGVYMCRFTTPQVSETKVFTIIK